jgi:hypothetical protein
MTHLQALNIRNTRLFATKFTLAMSEDAVADEFDWNESGAFEEDSFGADVLNMIAELDA